ncbi:TIGR04086 family membrane protein [Bacillus sp. HMF5848]|uniref:TIGR04086 family membrane protein n=1 Tax=Bacillus sp. HMF5848 TaxID=2495421 RepID=UPI000F7B4F8F|nr:TIGR04086 family membrane protein [Bacillus sp. HMF5848]RSK27993.1 TIGR04086 family membrane protein [Bacillus sp. HMF5848]
MDGRRVGAAILYGVLAILIVGVVTSLVFSLLLKFTDIEEEQVTWMITVCSFIALFIGGFISGGKGKEKGWLMGGLTALLFSTIVFLFQFLGFESTISIQQLLYHAGFLLTAIIGGAMGVNLSGNSRGAN